jgi:peptidyl-prolyl cis-trans isomerase A (cyclophilin A)
MKTLFSIIFGCLLSGLTVLAHAENPVVRMDTSLGPIVIELYPEDAPVTVENFLRYVDEDFYVGTIFHRVIDNFVVQGGGLTYDFNRKKTHEPIINESNNGLDNELGTLSMARLTDPNSATSQFFINLKHNESLDYDKKSKTGYAVFGKVIEGWDTVKKIEKEPRGLFRAEAPNYAVIVENVERIK